MREGVSEEYIYDSEITSMCCSPQGIVIGDSLGEVYLLDSVTSTERKFLTRVQGRVNCVVAHGEIIAVAGNQENLVVLESGVEKQLHEGCRSCILSVCISPNGKFIGAIGQDGWVHVFSDFKLSKKVQFTKKIKDDCPERFLSEFSPDSSCFALPGDLMFNYLQGADWKYVPSSLACKQNISIIRWPLLKTLLTASLDNQIRVWDLCNNEVLHTIDTPGSPWDFKLLGRSLIVALPDKTEVFKDLKLQRDAEKTAPEASDEEAEENGGKNYRETEADKALFDRTLGVYPQEPLVHTTSDHSFSVLFRSALGTVLSREYYSHTTAMAKIEIEFDDLSFHQNISFPNNHEFSLAYMGDCGALLASQVLDAALDDFVADHRSSCLLFHAFSSDTVWQSYLPNAEVPECLCVSSSCVVFTSLNYLRVFTLGGLQTLVVSMAGPVVTMAGHQNAVALVYHSAAPVLGCQALTGEIWEMDQVGIESEAVYFKEEFRIALTPGERIVWMGYSDTGVLFTVDSARVVRGLWRRAMNWVPLCSLQDYCRVVGVADSQVLLNLGENYRRIDLQEFEIPLCKGKAWEYEKRMIKEHFVIENHKEEIDKAKKFMELDKVTLEFYTRAVDEGDGDRAFAYGIQAKMQKTRLVFIKYAQELKVYSVAERLARHFGIAIASRFTRPERAVEEEKKVETSKLEVRNTIKEVPKENHVKPEQPLNPFQKKPNNSTDLFEALNSNLKRKPETINTSVKKLKK